MLFKLKQAVKRIPPVSHYLYKRVLYSYFKNEYPHISKREFDSNYARHVAVIQQKKTKAEQIVKLIDTVDALPGHNSVFFYSIDPYKKAVTHLPIYDNCSIDYSWAVQSSFSGILKSCKAGSSFLNQQEMLIDAMKRYVDKLEQKKDMVSVHAKSIAEIQSLFHRPAEHFHEGLQRILFVNQWLWQTGHKLNGLGHLDWILNALYQSDIAAGIITREEARDYIKAFFTVLHEQYWFKSSALLGDTGQIIILGGVGSDGNYRYNDLTRLFIEVSEELRLPDPKVLLRVSEKTPDDLIKLAVKCIGTGIGAPFLSNDDQVIPALIQYGYKPEDAFDYGTSACWEPLIIGKSCEQNNIGPVNFVRPFAKFINSDEFELCCNIESVLSGYYKYLHKYLEGVLLRCDQIVFEEDPMLTLFSPYTLREGKDIVRGGAEYRNFGLTSVGMACVVDSIINLKTLVFEKHQYTLHELNNYRKENYSNTDEVAEQLRRGAIAFGNDTSLAIELTNEILREASKILCTHQNTLGGSYKIGLSSPSYITDAKRIDATFDGRKAGMPFSTHISGKNAVAPTELIRFASKLDYGENRINGNVVDFFLSPGLIQNQFGKVVQLVKAGIRQGFYQLQINVVDSKTLIQAQQHPELFPSLVVRVWGFSAYFKDLPKEYQDNLIRRAIEAEAV